MTLNSRRGRIARFRSATAASSAPEETDVVSALLRKSTTDLTRRKSRTCFTIATLTLAITSIGLFALPNLMDRSMHVAVLSDQLPDLTVYTRSFVPDVRLGSLADLPNVRAVEPGSGYSGEMYVGARRAYVWVRGIPAFSRQTVDIVHLSSGSPPRTGEVLVDVRNGTQGLLDAHAGDTLEVIGADGTTRSLRVSGTAENLDGGQQVVSNGVIVLYATLGTVASLSGGPGYTTFYFRLDNPSRAAVDSTLAAIGRTFAAVPGFRGFAALPDVRASGDWPGKSSYTNLAKFFYIVTVLALLAALVLIANTMTALVSEQTSEIGIMKAVGGRRRQIAGVYLKTALLLGAIGTAAGIVLGLVIANLLTRYFGSHFYGVNVGIGADPLVILASAAVGLLGPPLAALPAIRRATRVPVREALEATGSAVGSEDAGDRTLRRVRFLPRTAQIGLRSVGRRRRRAFSTGIVIALAVGTLLALVGFGTGVANTSRASWHDHGEDFEIDPQGQPLGAFAEQLIRSTPGVAAVEPKFVTDVRLAGKDARIWAVQHATMFHYHIVAGRWLTASEEAERAHVAVIERDIARTTGTHLGDTIRVRMSSGVVDFRVIGISSNQQEDGTALYAPLTTMHALIPGMPADASDYWVRTTSHDHAFIDRTTTRVEDTLNANGYDVSAQIVYVRLANEVAHNRTLVTSVLTLGFLIVAISMAGLANALTMSVLERTREIGILRSIGARARHIRRIFATETIVLATFGWVMGIPVGLLLDIFLVWMTKTVIHVEVPLTFPFWNIPLALVGTILLALLITLVPIRRAVRFRPGDALRYA
jgi:putative ABC transport system permease protein